MKTKFSLHLAAGVAAVLSAFGAGAQEQPAAVQADQSAMKTWFEQNLPEAITNGKLHLNARFRYEYADRTGLRSSHAPIVRTRLGYETAPLHGFKGMIEFEDIRPIGSENNYFVPGVSGAGRTIIADPKVTELNQAWISYDNWDTTFKVGRQRILIDNQRFVGAVGWRHNEQTFDAFSVQNRSLPDTVLTYAYIHRVNRVFGDVSGLPPANRDLQSQAHAFNASYKGFKPGVLTAYAYLFEFDNASALSSATFGASFAGGHTFDPDTKARITYRAEYAHQIDYGNQPLNYDADYVNLELGGEYQRFNAGAGYELLGSDSGLIGFSTPLATLHGFNGWADVFLATPARGLRDLYAWVGVSLPYDVALKGIYHKYDSHSGSLDFGQEFDAIATKRFGKHWTGLVKYAYYRGKDAPFAFDLHRFWVQVEFNY